MNWKSLTTIDQLSAITKQSSEKPQLIFKHSTSCSISAMAKSRLERAAMPDDIDFYYLDLLSYRNISSQLATDFMVNHESPQVLLIINGECVYDESHSGISMDEIVQQAQKHAA
ncbi:MAG: bacillithiol system redox-active protein YtxJ [Ferruginibacter sp.]